MARMLDPSEKVLNSEAMKRKWSAGDSTEENNKNNSSSSISSSNGGSSETKSETKKTCADCGTSKTPLWRGGPAGPKSLCNACGIRSRKKRRAVIGGGGGGSEEKKPRKSGGGHNRNPRIGNSLKQRLMELGREVMMQRSTVEKQRRKLGEEEQAAVLLMALSYGSVYA